MNKGLYLYSGGPVVYWYKTWKNSSENSGASIDFENVGFWTWENWDDEEWGLLIGATCLAQW